MSLFVYDVAAADLQPLLRATRLALGNLPVRTSILPMAEAHTLAYTPSQEPLTQLVDELRLGEIASVMLQAETPVPRLFIFHPGFDGGDAAFWRLAFDYQGNDHFALFDALLHCTGLLFVALSEEEGLDELPREVDPESFPWNHWRLLRAAVAGLHPGDWVTSDPQQRGTRSLG